MTVKIKMMDAFLSEVIPTKTSANFSYDGKRLNVAFLTYQITYDIFKKFQNIKIQQDASKSFEGTTVAKWYNDLDICDLEKFMDKKCGCIQKVYSKK